MYFGNKTTPDYITFETSKKLYDWQPLQLAWAKTTQQYNFGLRHTEIPSTRAGDILGYQ